MPKTFSQLRNELNEADRVESTFGDLSKKEVKSLGKAEPKIPNKIAKSITNAPKNEPKIGDISDIGTKSAKQTPKTPSKLNNILSKVGKFAKEVPDADVRATNKIANAASSVGQKVVNKISSSPLVKKIASNPALRGVSKVAGPLTALDVGLGAGEVTRSALNKVGPSVKGDKVKNNAKSGLVFKGDLPTLPKEFPNKSSSGNAPRKSISQSDLGSALRGEPQTLKTPAVRATSVSPTKMATPSQSVPNKSSTPVSAGIKGGPNYPKAIPSAPVKSAPVTKSAPIKSAPVVKSAPTKSPAFSPSKSSTVTKTATPVAPVKKSLPMAKPVEKDPNAGGGFVTARAYGNKQGITSTQNRFGSGSKQTFMAPTPRRDTMSGGKSIPQSSSSAPKSTSSSSKPSTKDLF